MEGQIINFRRGRKTQTTNQMVVVVPGFDKAKAESELVGKTAIFTCEGKDKKEIKGTVTAIHGNKGAVRVHFETGMPGQAIGKTLEIK